MPRTHRLAFPLYVVGVAFVALEGLARVLFPEPVPFVVPSENPRLVYELNTERPEINSLGLRGPEPGPDWRSGRPFIAMVGDSHTYSVKVQQDTHTIPARLWWHLRKGEPALDATVLNFGVPGYNMAQELELLRTRVLPLEPDLVVLQYTINDLNVCNYIAPEHPTLNGLIHHSAFAVWAWKGVLYSPFGRRNLYDRIGRWAPDLLLYQRGLVGTLRTGPDAEPGLAGHPPRSPERVPARYHYMLGRERWVEHVREFGALARAGGAALLATGFIEAPDRDVYLAAGFEVLGFDEIFSSLDMQRDGGYDPADTSDHFDARGSDIVGRALAQEIRGRWGPRWSAR